MRKAKGILLLLILAFSLLLSVSISPFKPAQAQEEKCLKIYYDSEKGYYYFWTLNREKVVIERSGFAVLNRWDGEAWINFGSFPLEGEVEIEVEAELAENKLKWKGKWKIGVEEVEVEIELEPKNISEYGDLEWSMKLTDNPPINVFSMPIQSENLKFYYQPPLYEEYGFSKPFSNSTFSVNSTHVMRLVNGTWVNEAYRPENVVGSYAVYHATKTPFHKSKEEAEKYRAGKAFHIYRPKIIDAEGNEAWCNLNISDGILKIEIPQDFLDKAVYPVTIDPTFGYETNGGSSLDGGDRISGSWFTCPEAGTADSITAYLSRWGHWSGYHDEVKCAIYKKSDNSLVGESEEWYNEGWYGPDWHTFNFPTPKPSLQNIDYYLVVWSLKSDYNHGMYIYYDSETNKGAYQTLTYNSFPDPWSPTSEDKIYSIYCTYTAGAAGDTTPPTYSNVGANTTQAGQPCLFYCLWTDDTGLSGYIFSWNASGSWQNDTWTSLTGTSAWANVTKTLPSSHVVVGYRWYCNDTSNNWNETGIQFLQVVVSFQETIQETINVSGMLMKQIKTLQTQIVALPDSSNKLTHILNIESLLSSDRVIKSLAILKSDSLSFLDGFFKRTSLFFYEKIIIIEFLSKHFQTGKLESLNFADILSKLIVKTSKESLNSVDRPFKVLIKMEFEPLNMVTTLTKFIRIFRFESFQSQDLPFKLTRKIYAEFIVFSDRQFTSVFIVVKEQIIQDFINIGDRIIKHLTIVKTNPLALPETLTKNISIYKTESFNFLDKLFKRIGPFFYEKIVSEKMDYEDLVVILEYRWVPWYNDPIEFMKVLLYGFCLVLFVRFIFKRL